MKGGKPDRVIVIGTTLARTLSSRLPAYDAVLAIIAELIFILGPSDLGQAFTLSARMRARHNKDIPHV